MTPTPPVVALEPRTLGECIDLAVIYCRSHAATIATLSVLVGALPTTVVVLRAGDGYGWLWGAGTFCFASPLLGTVLVVGAGRQLFGQPFTVPVALGSLRHLGSLIVSSMVARGVWLVASAVSVGLLAIPSATVLGLLPEVVALERVETRRALSRCRHILHGGFWEACGRCAGCAGFAVACAASLFFTVDLTSQFVLQTPVFLGRTSSSMFLEDATHLLSYDPLTLGVASACAWLAYPLGRLAWLFCYIDQRIRGESWDLELDVRAEALRVKHAA